MGQGSKFGSFLSLPWITEVIPSMRSQTERVQSRRIPRGAVLRHLLLDALPGYVAVISSGCKTTFRSFIYAMFGTTGLAILKVYCTLSETRGSTTTGTSSTVFVAPGFSLGHREF